jgi:hypothetical protein
MGWDDEWKWNTNDEWKVGLFTYNQPEPKRCPPVISIQNNIPCITHSHIALVSYYMISITFLYSYAIIHVNVN